MISTLRRIFTQIITHKGLNDLQQLLITLVGGGQVASQIKEVLSRVLKDEDSDQENSLIHKYGKQIIEMNLDYLLTQSDNHLDLLSLTRVLVEIEPKIVLKKVKLINMIMVSFRFLNYQQETS